MTLVAKPIPILAAMIRSAVRICCVKYDRILTHDCYKAQQRPDIKHRNSLGLFELLLKQIEGAILSNLKMWNQGIVERRAFPSKDNPAT